MPGPSLVMFYSSVYLYRFVYEPTPQAIWNGKLQPLETAYETVLSKKGRFKNVHGALPTW